MSSYFWIKFHLLGWCIIKPLDQNMTSIAKHADYTNIHLASKSKDRKIEVCSRINRTRGEENN